jgi:hypothetical protein
MGLLTLFFLDSPWPVQPLLESKPASPDPECYMIRSLLPNQGQPNPSVSLAILPPMLGDTGKAPIECWRTLLTCFTIFFKYFGTKREDIIILSVLGEVAGSYNLMGYTTEEASYAN